MMRLVIESRLPEIRRATRLVDEFRARHGLGDEDATALHIVIDEVLSNAIRHGRASQAIELTLELSGEEIRVEVVDDGQAYDPTEAPAPVLADTLGGRHDGGLGLAFMRALTDGIEYQRTGDRNRLVLRRRVRGTSPPGP